jgi:prepilin-type processing-associated H-X9-DG protein
VTENLSAPFTMRNMTRVKMPSTLILWADSNNNLVFDNQWIENLNVGTFTTPYGYRIDFRHSRKSPFLGNVLFLDGHVTSLSNKNPKSNSFFYRDRQNDHRIMP